MILLTFLFSNLNLLSQVEKIKFSEIDDITQKRIIIMLCGRHDTQYNDTQHNDTQHERLICDTQHIRHSA